MNDKPSESKWKSRFKQLGRDILIVLVIFIVIDFWQRKDLLETSSFGGEGAVIEQMTYTDLEGQSIDLLNQEKTQFIYFFAPWCTVCGYSIGNIHRHALAPAFQDDVHFRFVALDYEDEDSVKAFVDEHQLEVPILMGDRRLREAFKIEAYPTYYILDKSGKVLTHSVGYTTTLGTYARLFLYGL